MNSSLNRISLDIPEADLQAVRDALQVLQDKLLPHLLAPVPDERRELPKMGDKTVAFVRKAVEYARADASLRPSYLDVEEMEGDLQAVDILASMQRPLGQLLAGLDDSVLAAGSEVYSGALAYYQAVKGAARARVQGAETIANDLRKRFPGRARTRSGEAPAAPTSLDSPVSTQQTQPSLQRAPSGELHPVGSAVRAG